MKNLLLTGVAGAALLLAGAAQAKVINGTAKADKLNGTAQADTINGNGGNDTIQGSGGNDTISGGDGNDVVRGGVGNDTIRGDTGDDTLFGDAGNDTFFGGFGDDKIFGGDNIDTVDYSNVSAPDAQGYGIRSGDLSGGQIQTSTVGNDTVSQIENLVGTKFKDQLYGNQSANVLSGGAGDDYINGQGGNDTYIGGTGLETYDFSYHGGDPVGRVTIADFTKGQDKVGLHVHPDALIDSFYDLDTNGDGVLNNLDTYVYITSATYGGKSKLSTVIDFSSFVGQDYAIVYYGVTGLTANDFTQ